MSLLLDAQEKWEDFLENKITNYEKLRNFDYGPTNESSFSKLSPYISHRVLLEYELLKEVKKNIIHKSLTNLLKRFIGEFIGKVGWKIDQRCGAILFQKKIMNTILKPMKKQ